MSYTQEQVDALRAAIATGALEVQQGQERVRYRSLAEMERVLATAEASGWGERAAADAFQPDLLPGRLT